MKNQSLIGLFFASSISFASPAFAALTITEVNNADILANEILGTGASLSGNATYTGALKDPGVTNTFTQAGTFTGGLSSGFEFDSGIYLSTGSIIDDGGMNGNLTSDLGGNGDADLESILNEPAPPISFNTSDAAVLEFTFFWDNIANKGEDLVFNYIFASEEYNEFVGTGFNDVFGFFIDGVNYALTDTTPLVSVDNFNLNTNSGSYNNNDGGAFDNLYDGFTKILTASASGLATGDHIAKIAIADVGQMGMDGILDSGVFIQSNSFSDNPTPVPVPLSVLFFASGLFGLAGTKRILKRT